MKIRWKRLLSSLVASCLLAAGLVGCSNNQPTETGENSDIGIRHLKLRQL